MKQVGIVEKHLENESMKVPGIFRLSVRDILVLIVFVGGLSTQYYAIKSSIAVQDVKVEVIIDNQKALDSKMDLLDLKQQQLRLDMAVTQLQVKRLEDERP